jgi:hypothetical protein
VQEWFHLAGLALKVSPVAQVFAIVPGLLVSQFVLALVLVPVSIELMDWALGAQARVSAGKVLRRIC